MVQVILTLARCSCCLLLLGSSTLVAQESITIDALSGSLAEQTTAGQTTAGQSSDQSATEQSTTEKNGLEFVALTRAAQGWVKPGSPIILQARVKNWSDKSAEGTLVGKLSGSAGDEYRRQFKLEPKQDRSFDLPILMPNKIAEKTIEIAVTLNVIEGGREVLLRRRNDEPASQTLPMSIAVGESMTALYLHSSPSEIPNWRWPGTEKFSSYEFAITTRVEAAFARTCAMYDNRPLPLSMADWDAIDVFVVSEPAVFDDINAVATMQQFLRRGGRVWVMLDRVETDRIRELLEANQLCETVDTVELNRFEAESPLLSLAAADRLVDRDKPAKLTRVIQQGGKVTQSMDGWPLAIFYPVGSGELIVTTLESDAWLLPNSVHRSPDAAYQSLYKLPLWGTGFSASVHSPKAIPPFAGKPVEYPLELIGNPVVSFRLVGTILVTFCLLLLGFGLWRIVSQSDLSWIGGVAPAMALLASIPLIAVALSMRRDIPDMITKLQVVQLSERGGGTLHEQAAVYAPQELAMKLSSKLDGIAVASPTVQTGVRMFTIEDTHQWNLFNQNWPTGTWRYETRNGLNLPPMTAIARLTEEGLSVELPQELPSTLEDPVVSFTRGGSSLGKLVEQGKQLLVDGQFEGAGERWTTNSIISDEQRRRAVVYDTYFQPRENQQHPVRTLYGWTQLWESPQWDVDFEQRGAALVGIPIQLVTPPLGTSVFIPHSIVAIERSQVATSPTNIYDFNSGRWAGESTLVTDATVSFILPPEVVPLEASTVKLEWDIRAPNRSVRLSNPASNQSFEIVSLDSPSLPGSMTLTDKQVLGDLKDGRFELRIQVTERAASAEEQSSSFVSWQVNHLRISVAGKTLPRDDFSERVAGSTNP